MSPIMIRATSALRSGTEAGIMTMEGTPCPAIDSPAPIRRRYSRADDTIG